MSKIPICEICGEDEDHLYKCSKCGNMFCEWCGLIDDLLCDNCTLTDDDGDEDDYYEDDEDEGSR